jgi:hypothetical protein
MAHRPEATALFPFSADRVKSVSSYWLKRGIIGFGSGLGTFAASNAVMEAAGVSERNRLTTAIVLTVASMVSVNLVSDERMRQIAETTGRVNRFMWFSN